MVSQTLQTAVEHHQSGRLGQAEALYKQILAKEPNDADALHLLGVIAAVSGQLHAALDLIRRALIQRPGDSQIWYDLANTLISAGRWDDAVAAYRHAIEIKPDYIEAYSNLGVALRARGEADQAIAAFRQAIALRPIHPKAYTNLGNALKDTGQLDQSVAAYRQAIALKPDLAEAHNNLGVALEELGRFDEGIAAHRQAILLSPGFAEAHNNLGVALHETGNMDDAIASYRKAIAIQPGYSEARFNLANVLMDTGQLDDAIACYRQVIAAKPDFLAAHNNLVYALRFHPDYDAAAIAAELRHWRLQHSDPLKKFVQPHANDKSPDRRLRVGYVSPDFREHPVGRFLLPLLEQHDRSCFEIFAYSQIPVSDAVTVQLRSHTDAWRSIAGLTDAQVADQIRGDRIDILVDLTMHMARNRLLVFARKPAPVQVTWLAYCSTTGLDSIDYRLSDPQLDPIDMDESVYTERTIRLPETYWCYQPAIAPMQINISPALERGYVMFGCLNNFAKVNELTLITWANLLRIVAGSHLLLHAPEGAHRQQLLERLNRDGIQSDRIHFAGKLPLADYFRLYQQIDIALDPFPYGGGTTTCDAIWMGVPVVSLIGKTAVGRGGFSILTNLGLPELAALSQDQYVQIASGLANDLPRLSSLRSTLQQRMERSPLMDAPRFARNIESAFSLIWRRWCETPDQG